MGCCWLESRVFISFSCLSSLGFISHVMSCVATFLLVYPARPTCPSGVRVRSNRSVDHAVVDCGSIFVPSKLFSTDRRQ